MTPEPLQVPLPHSPCEEAVSPSKSKAALAGSPCTTTTSSLTTPEDWYLLGKRLVYDVQDKQIVEDSVEEVEEVDEVPEPQTQRERLHVFHRVVLPCSSGESQRWMTFLPNDPEGSYGFHLVEETLSCGLEAAQRTKARCDTEGTVLSSAASVSETVEEVQALTQTQTHPNQHNQHLLARLYLDYPGQGDSDTPSSPTSSTIKQRADLVEALWAHHNIQRTVLVSAGDSSLVTMELLQRQRLRLACGSPFPKILHVLSLNGRYVAKTRHSSQLATVTQLLRSDVVGPSLAAKAQRSDFTLSQCLAPYLRASSRSVRKQVAQLVRRHQGSSSLVDMARIVDDHLHDRHRYRWHMPHLIKVFTMDQGITFHLVSNTRPAQRQVRLVQDQLQEYSLDDCPGIQYTDYTGKAAPSTSTFLLDPSPQQLEAFIHDIYQLANEEIPLSANATSSSARAAAGGGLHRLESVRSSFDIIHYHGEGADEGEDSWHPNEEVQLSESDLQPPEGDDNQESSVDSRLDTEIVFDASEMDDDDWDFF